MHALSQIQALNPILILTFIPLFSYILYPLIDRVFPLTPLRKISIGLFVMVVAFALVSVAQMKIDAGETPSISWQLVAFVALTASEVMVSIVCLEFSYTQAPRAMKSFVMALFLFAVFAGNLLTAQINDFIQVKNPLATVEAVDSEASLGGYDGKVGTLDDLVLSFDSEGRRTDLQFRGRPALDALADEMIAEIESSDFSVPSQQAGEEKASAVMDPWGNPYRYQVINRNRIRISSDGPDQKQTTKWDQGVVLEISRPESSAPGAFTRWMSHFKPDQPWLESRKAALGVPTQAEVAEKGPTISKHYFVGGQVRLEGAAYFWFFTGLMLASALAFVVVAKLYRPREYYHDEATDAEAREEASRN